MENFKEDGCPEVKLIVRQKEDKDNANYGKLVEAIKASKQGKTLGVFSKDQFKGKPRPQKFKYFLSCINSLFLYSQVNFVNHGGRF